MFLKMIFVLAFSSKYFYKKSVIKTFIAIPIARHNWNNAIDPNTSRHGRNPPAIAETMSIAILIKINLILMVVLPILCFSMMHTTWRC